MLILKRRYQERIFVETPAGVLVVQVTNIRGIRTQAEVSVGIECPKDWKIRREEKIPLDERIALSTVDRG